MMKLGIMKSAAEAVSDDSESEYDETKASKTPHHSKNNKMMSQTLQLAAASSILKRSGTMI